MADTKGFGLVVYDASKQRMCRVESIYMKPTDTDFSIANKTFSYEGGIFTLTMVKNNDKNVKNNNGNSKYFLQTILLQFFRSLRI